MVTIMEPISKAIQMIMVIMLNLTRGVVSPYKLRVKISLDYQTYKLRGIP